MRLSALLASERAADERVARCGHDTAQNGHDVTWTELRHDVARLHGRLVDSPAGAFVLVTDDAYAFSVGLLALWHAGHTAILPPNRQPHALERLQTRAVGVISDRADWIPGGSALHPLRDGLETSTPAFGPLDPDAPAIELFTSGTTSDEKPVSKRLRHLEDEVLQLESTWGERVADATFFSTTSHQHLYGLLFGVLWPLCSGRRFDATHYLHAGELVPRMRGEASSVLASVPTSLRHLVRHRDTAALGARCRAVFSSGGPLAAETSHAVADALGHAPIEVLGSTETGGIAWRTQCRGTESSWTPFPCAEIRRDEQSGVLRVSSPLVSVDQTGDGYSTGDQIVLHPDGTFDLCGRADLIVKIGEKRLDLGSMASQLRGHAWVDDVALTTIERQSEERVAALVVPSERGREVLGREGRRAFSTGLRDWLANGWDPVLHPRHWRIVSELPENAQGKITRRAVSDLFCSDAPQAVRADRPQILEEVRGDDWIERSCVVPPDLDCFAGHFPGGPVVPGVLQLDWAMDLAAALLGTAPIVDRIETLKLLEPLGPGERFALHVRIAKPRARAGDGEGRPKFEFVLQSADAKFSTGRVQLRGEGAADEKLRA